MTLTPQLNKEVMVTEATSTIDNSFRYGPGRQLQTAREALRKSVEEIAEHLRLTKTMVLAIEQDRYEPLHVPFTFIRGYLRAYARLVHLSPEMIVKTFDQLGLVEQRTATRLSASPFAEHHPRKKQIPLNWLIYSGIAASILLIGGIWFWTNMSEQQDPMRQDLVKLLNNIDKEVTSSSLSPIKDASAYGYNGGAVGVEEQFPTNDQAATAPVEGNIVNSQAGTALQSSPMPGQGAFNVNNTVNQEMQGQNTPEQPYEFGAPNPQALQER